MATEKKKLKALSKEETATLLREIADCMEGKSNGVTPASIYPVQCSRFKYLELEISQSFEGTFRFKAKSKPMPDPEASDKRPSNTSEKNEKPKYKKLKKRMKQDFRRIHDALAANQLPGDFLLRSFLDDSDMMTSHKNHGDSYYAPYRSACDRLKEAVEAKDLLSAKGIYQELNQIKADCHRKYK